MRYALLALALVGCAYGPAPEGGFVGSTLSIDPAFSSEERDVIVDAQAQWATVTKGPLPSGWRIVLEQPSNPTALGHADEDMRTIWIRPGLPRDVFYATVLHELGHAHGIWTHVREGVMQSEASEPPIVTFTEDDLAACRRFGVC